MFKKLRNKLILVNMIIISSFLAGSFCVIYTITWQNVKKSTQQELIQTIQFERHFIPPGIPGSSPDGENSGRRGFGGADDITGGGAAQSAPDTGTFPFSDNKKDSENRREMRNKMSAHFIIYTDADGNFKEIHSPLTIENTGYLDEIAKIKESGSDNGIISYAGGYWAYMRVKSGSGYVIAFIDYTSERKILINLLFILLLVWIAAVAAAFLISLKNADKSIRPVEESYNRQKQFVADASHELKTPLTTINTNIDVLLTHRDSTIAEEEKWLFYIKNEAERMTKLTNDLLYLARLDHTEEKPPHVSASFSDTAENVLLTMEAVIFEKNIEFCYDIEPDITVAVSDEQLKQLVMILLDNAVKYTPMGGKINMRLKREKNDAFLTVRNTGQGISEKNLRHIFDRFYRADESRARESGGYGLGLSIAKAICENAGGSISVNSAEGEFTEFTVHIHVQL